MAGEMPEKTPGELGDNADDDILATTPKTTLRDSVGKTRAKGRRGRPKKLDTRSEGGAKSKGVGKGTNKLETYWPKAQGNDVKADTEVSELELVNKAGSEESELDDDEEMEMFKASFKLTRTPVKKRQGASVCGSEEKNEENEESFEWVEKDENAAANLEQREHDDGLSQDFLDW